ncbi:UDP-N-acetylmuramoylalanyl-D-glutamyl-2, 6-diaminopimelate--D-alanyl-D-alanine ligase [Pelomonas sp. Root1217]|uniref:UDP-N-acetylmuramoyl-tripeptide--D-alanyl-D- alanine ligase n=1 Tax=Pelomonas sp. Root1217 TaxID=1736430 RepID=UPI00070B0E37|nr:UDP-N-acetylmuramoyl-tripeptide--D-alanyl-D-alanine ligase [Pelomonas sp. Root1217]KQV60960.1 UDP-N-acetylmuramoylalanyl-D-glutamyl-2, 6-diaminopimelate--D-alanyl-D-alanine ligase [Pelomonas sp. Root1217]
MNLFLTLSEAQALLPGSTLVGDGATGFARVHSDTRTLRTGDLFVALRGERFDANDFLSEAKASGAVAALAERGLAEAGLPGLLVPDAKAALGQLAAAWRRQQQLPVIAVTGSNGKTTTTQMIASILRAWVGEAALATEGNYNNDIGVPLTLLRLRHDDETSHRAAVVELGMNHPGEIAPLAAMTQPTVALVNNAQREHQEFMATVEAVARENGAVIEALAASGCAVFPAEDACAPIWLELAGSRPHLSFALRGKADVTGDAAWIGTHWALELHTPAGTAPVALHMAGEHNVRNALAAAACALAAGAPLSAIAQGLEVFRAVKGRSELKTDARGRTLIDDSYNANPDSVRAAIDVLAGMPGEGWLILGDMGEVGNDGPAFHREVGAYAAERGIAHFWTAGSAARDAAAAYGPGARAFDNAAALIAALNAQPSVAQTLVKGSRFMKMEQVVAALQTTTGDPHVA